MSQALATKIIAERKKKGLTQEQLAEDTGVSLRTIQRLEKGKVKPQLNTLCQMARAFDINIEELTLEDTAPEAGQSVGQAKTYNKNELAVLHLTPLALLFVPTLGNIIGPVVFWLWKRKEHEIFNRQGVQLINFQLTYTLAFILIVFILPFTVFFAFTGLLYPAQTESSTFDANVTWSSLGFYFVALIIFTLYFFVITIVNAVRVSREKEPFYPLTIRFLKAKEENDKLKVQGA